MLRRVPVDVWIGIAAAALFGPGLGAVHLFDRDEINFAEIAREMLVTGDWSRPRVGFRPFYEKPPLFMWLQALSMAGLGVTALPFVMMNPALIAPLVGGDAFVRASLQADVPWTGGEALAGVWLLGVLGAAHWLHRRGAPAKSTIVLFAGTGLFVPIGLFCLAGNIEAHSQRAAVEFFRARQGERCYVLTRSYRTYAHWFYARTTEAAPEDPVLLRGAIDRPVYLAVKITAVEESTVPSTFREVGRNGFAFWRRDP